jgi:hypothetical protein
MTLLAKAYMEGLFPRAKKGEIFFEKTLGLKQGMSISNQITMKMCLSGKSTVATCL